MPQFIDQSLGMEKVRALTPGLYEDWTDPSTIPQAELNAYWCWFAMVRKEYQGQGLCRQMFDLVNEKVSAAGDPRVMWKTSRFVVGEGSRRDNGVADREPPQCQ